MNRYWKNKKICYSIIGVLAIILLALAVWLVLRPKPLANYPDFVDKFNRIVESGGTKYHISDYDVEGHKSFGGNSGRLTVQVSHGKLMGVGITQADETSKSDSMDSFVVYATASAKALGISKDAVLGVVSQSIRSGKGKRIVYHGYVIKATNVSTSSFSLISVDITRQ